MGKNENLKLNMDERKGSPDERTGRSKSKKSGLSGKKSLMRQPSFLIMTAVFMLIGATAAWFLNNTLAGHSPMEFEAFAPMGTRYDLYKWDQNGEGNDAWIPVQQVDFNLQVPNAVYRYKIIISGEESEPGDYDLELDLKYPQGYEYGTEGNPGDLDRVEELYNFLYIKTIETAAEGEPSDGRITNYITYGAVVPGATGAAVATEEEEGIYCFANHVTTVSDRTLMLVPTAFEAVGGTENDIVSYFDIYIHKDATVELKDAGGNTIQQDISSLDISGVLGVIPHR